MKRIILVLILFFTVINISNAMTVNELVNSYNFSYSSSDFVLVLDKQNITKNILNFSLNINSIKGNYTFFYGVKNNLIETNKVESRNLIYGNNIVNLSLNLSYLENNNYFLYLNVYKNNNIIFREKNLLNFKILNSLNLILDKSQILNGQNYILLNESKNINNVFKKNIIVNLSSKFPDISIKNISYNKTTGITIIKIKNIGGKNAIGFVINIFDENLSKIKENLIPIILINQTVNTNYTIIKNLSEIYISIFNYDNSDKNLENNFLFWPVNLTEICNDNIDNDRDELVDEGCVLEIRGKGQAVGGVRQEVSGKRFEIGGKRQEVGGSSGGGSSSGKKLVIGDEEEEENKILQVRKSKESKNINENSNNNLDLIENIPEKLSNQVNKLIKINSKNISKNSFNSTPFETNNNYIKNNNSKSKDFLKENKVTISGFLFGIVSFVFYLLLA